MYKKSSFKYWFAHWCAFNMTAINLGCWKPRFLRHDIEKPWLFLILRDYNKVKKIHRMFSKHHMENDLQKDLLAMVIDWECSKFTKPDAQLNARETMDKYYPEYKEYLEPVLEKLNL